MRVKIELFLREVCEKTTKNNEYPVLTSSKSGLFLQSDYFNKQVASTDNTGYKIIKKGQFTYRAMSDTGEFYPNMLECVDVGIVSPAYPVFEIFQTDLIIPEYLKYYFKSNAFQHAISSFAQGSTRTSVKFNKLKTASIDLPSKQEQTKILRLLKKAETLIACRQQELQKLDDLVKARFVEMFGNPEHNDKRWREKPLFRLCKVGSSKRIYQNELCEQGVPFLKISDLVCKMDKGSCKYAFFIPEDKYDELVEQGLVPSPGDILLTARGTLGRCYIIATEDRFYFQDGMITWLSDFDESICSQYIAHLFSMKGVKKQIEGLQAGSTVAYLSIAMTKNLKIMVPPIDLQKNFIAFVEQIDKSKFVESIHVLKLIKEAIAKEVSHDRIR